MSWTDITDFFTDTKEFFEQVYDIILLMLAAVNRTTIYLDSINFNDSVMANYLGYIRYITGDVVYFAIVTGAQIALGITLWKLLLRGVGMIKNLLPW